MSEDTVVGRITDLGEASEETPQVFTKGERVPLSSDTREILETLKRIEQKLDHYLSHYFDVNSV
jgi:hypothetical protein